MSVSCGIVHSHKPSAHRQQPYLNVSSKT